MLYDEEGRAYVEPPLLPENVHLRYIVSDYRRMYIANKELERRNQRLRDNLRGLNGLQYAYSRIVLEQHKHIGQLIKMLDKKELPVPSDVRIYHEQIENMLYYNQKRKQK